MNGGKICPAMSVQADNRKVSGIGSSFTEYAKEKLQCVLCGSEVQQSCLATHQGSKKCIHGRKEWSALHPNDEEEEETPLPTFFMPPSEYCISISKDAVETQCPVTDCPNQAKGRGYMRLHFRNRHQSDTIQIEEEGLLPRCSECGLFQRYVGLAHQGTASCKTAKNCGAVCPLPANLPTRERKSAYRLSCWSTCYRTDPTCCSCHCSEIWLSSSRFLHLPSPFVLCPRL
jgi:hypothetical protein